ncbi:diaminopimelate decarboxylase [Tepidibacter aestuarii]|uniref:diaminopimelate decarboxylase n=1 Tax=Tepidibacter aestuarii TaxID=2925782 RepID=UPI0020C11ED3|nr:diaminopimelate decarboxylase [Tepidibacter aestuarii]CAH2214169.1 Diaminopimelate decarboxylase [Tepidibacter aestuarii]
MRLFGNYNVKENEMYIHDFKLSDIAKEFKTPLYVYDEELVRNNIRKFKQNFECSGKNIVAYAGKAFLTPYMCSILKEEGAYLDVVSGGELYVAKYSGFPMKNIIFHGNNKSKNEIVMGIDYGVGRFVVDNFTELKMIDEIAGQKNKKINVLIRISPGVDSNTHEYIKTGVIDTKFGFSMNEKDYLGAVRNCLEYKNINLLGIHCHVGSQICEVETYINLSNVMMNIIKEIKEIFNYTIEEFDIGGGFGVYYNEDTNPTDIRNYTDTILNSTESNAINMNIKMPRIIIEPGRSIIANSGVTIYEVGAIKNIKGVRKYVSVDGGMTDNIRPALYKAEYEVALTNRVEDRFVEKVTVCGKCCESGDILIRDVDLPKVNEGDLLTIMSTGAYGYSMASNYNMALIPGVVFVNKGEYKLVCKRQDYNDLIKNCI